jgi:hypothetical protein
MLNDCQQGRCILPVSCICAAASCTAWLLVESVQLLRVLGQCMLPGLLPASGLCAVASCPDWLLVRPCGGGDGLRKHFESIIWSAVAAGEDVHTIQHGSKYEVWSKSSRHPHLQDHARPGLRRQKHTPRVRCQQQTLWCAEHTCLKLPQ